jgi:predicted LPLAT superfamily acyltransferase
MTTTEAVQIAANAAEAETETEVEAAEIEAEKELNALKAEAEAELLNAREAEPEAKIDMTNALETKKVVAEVEKRLTVHIKAAAKRGNRNQANSETDAGL